MIQQMILLDFFADAVKKYTQLDETQDIQKFQQISCTRV